MKYINEKVIMTAYISTDETTDTVIAVGWYRFVFGTPELLVGVRKSRDVYREHLIGMTVNEVYTTV